MPKGKAKLISQAAEDKRKPQEKLKETQNKRKQSLWQIVIEWKQLKA